MTKEIKQDLQVWLDFFRDYNGCTFFRPRHAETSLSLNLYTDASPAGAGGVFQDRWFQFAYPQSWATKNITLLELFPIMVALEIFIKEFSNKSLIFHTDNIAISHVLNKQTSKEPSVMVLVRRVVLLCLRHNCRFVSEHVAGVDILPDRLSRFQAGPRLLGEYNMGLEPETIPRHLLLSNFVLD